MNFTIRAVKDGESSVFVQAGPTLTVAKARMLSKAGWAVQIIDGDGMVYAPAQFDQLLSFDRPRGHQVPHDKVLDIVSAVLGKRTE